ncbi:MAG: hypothetical protein IKR57_00175 [Bacilli bacterium]|nr:hypothetical protein [Bacilli bacterium]
MSKEFEKFYLFLKSHIVELLNRIEALSINLDMNSIGRVLSNKKRILEIDESLLNDIDLISFFYSENITDVSQVTESLNRISESIKKATSSVEELIKEKEECEHILNNENYDFNFFVKMLEKSNLTEKEKIEILKSVAYETCFANDIKEEKKEEVEEPKTIKIEDEKRKKLPDLGLIEEDKKEDNTQDLMSRYEALNAIISSINTSYHHLIKGKTEKQINYYEQYVEAVKDVESETNKFEYIEYKLIVEIIKLLKCRDEVEELLKSGKLDNELLELGISEIEELLDGIEKTSEELNKRLSEQNPNDSRNIFFFTEDGETPYFDVSKLDGEERKTVLNIIKDLENGLLDEAMSTTRKVKMNESRDYNIYAYKKNLISMTYIKPTIDKLLILTMAKSKEVFDETISLSKKYDRQIKAQMESIVKEDKGYLDAQNQMLSSIKEDLSNGRTV